MVQAIGGASDNRVLEDLWRQLIFEPHQRGTGATRGEEGQLAGQLPPQALQLLDGVGLTPAAFDGNTVTGAPGVSFSPAAAVGGVSATELMQNIRMPSAHQIGQQQRMLSDLHTMSESDLARALDDPAFVRNLSSLMNDPRMGPQILGDRELMTKLTGALLQNAVKNDPSFRAQPGSRLEQVMNGDSDLSVFSDPEMAALIAELLNRKRNQGGGGGGGRSAQGGAPRAAASRVPQVAQPGQGASRMATPGAGSPVGTAGTSGVPGNVGTAGTSGASNPVGTLETVQAPGGRPGGPDVIDQGDFQNTLPGGKTVASVGCMAAAFTMAANHVNGTNYVPNAQTISAMNANGGFQGNLIVRDPAAAALGADVRSTASGSELLQHLQNGGSAVVPVQSKVSGRPDGHWVTLRMNEQGQIEAMDPAGGVLRGAQIRGNEVSVESYGDGINDYILFSRGS